MIFWKVHVKGTNISVFCTAAGREQAKDSARDWIGNGAGGGPDNWEVTPLTSEGDRYKIETFHV